MVSKFTRGKYYLLQIYESYSWCYVISIPIKWNRAKTCKKYENIDPEFTRKVKKHFYVDDLNSVAQSTKEGFKFYKKVKSRFSEASLNIKKWRTNDPDLRKLIHDYENREIVNIERPVNREVSNYVNIVNTFNNEKVLGLYWDHQRDVISLKISEIFREAVNIIPTKRNTLSIIASVYDPIGYLEPRKFKLPCCNL